MPHTFTDHTFRCSRCGRLARASEAAIAEERANCVDADHPMTDAELAAGFEFCLACCGIPTDGEFIPECRGAEDVHGQPACTGEHPKRYAFATREAPTVWSDIVYCDECAMLAAVDNGYAIVPCLFTEA